MDGMLSLFDTICHSDYQDEVFHAFLNSCSDQKAFVNKTSSAIQPIVAQINNKLNSSSSRFEGLLLLKTYLPQCSVDIFGENVVSWMQLCLKAGEIGQNKYEIFSTSYQILKMLLQMSENLPEMKRPISGLIVPKIIENFQQITPQEVSLSVFECLELLMYKYGPACGQQKNNLEKCILQYVDCKENDVMKRVARCLAYLPLLGGGGPSGVNHITRWNQYQQKLCTTLHDILDELFDDIREVPNSYCCVTSQKLALPEIKESSPLLRVHRLVTRFINISKCLQSLLILEFPVEKAILPDAILGVVCRVLAVNSCSLGKKISAHVLMIGAMLPQIHIMHLRLLDSLITCCRRNLLPYAPVICKLVLQTLKWTSEEKWVYGIEKPHCQLREAACNSLKLWLQVSYSGSCVELIADQLIPLLIQDIWFEKESVTLIAQNNKNGNRIQRRPSGQDQITGMNVRNSKRYVPNKTANNSICRAALQLLQWVLHSAAPFLKPSIHRLLQEKTVGLLFEIQRTSNPEDLPVPFSEPACRLELYQLLYTLNLEPHTVWPPPTQFALYILAAGRSDKDLKVSAFCTSSLAAIEKVIHPCGGTLQFPVALEEMVDLTKNYRQEYIIPLNEHTISNGNTFEKIDVAQKEEIDNSKSTNEVKVKEGPKHSRENHNSSEDVEIVNQIDDDGDDEVEEIDEEGEEEEEEDEDDECVDSEECDSEFLDEDNDSVMSVNSIPRTMNQKKIVKKFQKETKTDDETPFIEVADSNGENENMNNGSTSVHESYIGHKQKDNVRSISKVNESKKQPISFVRCRSDLQVTQIYTEDKLTQMSNSCNRDKLLDLVQIPKGHGPISKGTEITKRELDDKSMSAPQVMQTKFPEDEEEEEEIDDEEEDDDEIDEEVDYIDEVDEMGDIGNIDEEEDDEYYDEEPNPKKMKLDSPASVKSIKSIRETPECLENNIGDNETDPLKNDEENEEDTLQVNGITVESEEVSEEEMIKSFVDAVAE